ncbi:ATP diphosphatase [Desulfuromusa kysingii]|uniref:ATP diphosphatase n=1 Tax=Desulfuromusa kysingii TaxID=37625 RepID=A0A1H4D3D1_9BACT|nr:nucleoside triphosphate pyrophosphohydrolase [Desulfuromusa kysingii]SEA66822.1 ATP diphosphatase [Desulfuromusa kysingii]
MKTKSITDEMTKLSEIMTALRAPDGCPWDRKQTAATLKPYILEEAYELIDAISKNDTAEIRDELGDLLFQVVFIAQIYNEKQQFDLADVALSISNKMIRRHPHVFAGENVNDHAKRWDEIKQQERVTKGGKNKLMDRIPENLPALKVATKVASKIEKQDLNAQIDKIQKKLLRLKIPTEELTINQDKINHILADILFATVQIAKSLNCDAEDILRMKTIQVMTQSDT